MLLVFLSYILAIWICLTALRITGKEDSTIFFKGKKTKVDYKTLFAAFTLMTAPNFISLASEIKYIWWIGLVLILLLSKKYIIPFCGIIWWLFIIIIYLSFGLLFGRYWIRGSMMVLKYIILLLFFIIGFNVDITHDRVCFVFEYGLKGIVLALIFASGMTMCLLPPVYWVTYLFFFGQAGISDCFTVFMPICLSAALLTQNKKYILICILCLLSDICFVVRTGIGGWCVAVGTYLFLSKKIRYLFLLIFIAFLVGFSFIYLEPLRNKTYTPEIQARYNREGFGLYLFDRRNLRDSGRTNLQEMVYSYYSHTPLWGNGTGATNTVLRKFSEDFGLPAIMHNDYVVMAIDNGILGVILWIIMVILISANVIMKTFSKTCSPTSKILGITAFSSFSGAMFAMGFDNVIAHSMSSIGISFLLIGMFYRSIRNDSDSNILQTQNTMLKNRDPIKNNQ